MSNFKWEDNPETMKLLDLFRSDDTKGAGTLRNPQGWFLLEQVFNCQYCKQTDFYYSREVKVLGARVSASRRLYFYIVKV